VSPLARGSDLIAGHAPRPSDPARQKPAAPPPNPHQGSGPSRGSGRTEREAAGTLKDKMGHKAGKALRNAAEKGLEAHGVPPVVSRRVIDRAANTALGRKLVNAAPGSKAIKDGFLGQESRGGKEKKADASGHGSGSGSVEGRSRRKAVAIGLPVMAVFGVLLMFAALLGGQMAIDGTQTQPTSTSDNKVEPYTPGGWLSVLKNAAATTAGEPDYANVPWTVLAGVARAQTDFGRYSPYDNIDRDPGRTGPEISPGGTGTSDVNADDTSGAGPGPIQGVSGPGESTSLSPDHPGPPAGDLSHQLGWFLWALRDHESGGNYTARNGDACGAYQYLTSTWVGKNKGDGYADACAAPPSVQDKRALSDVIDSWNGYHMWQQVAADHLIPAWANSTQGWNRCPNVCVSEDPEKGNPTVWQYVDDVMKRMRQAAADHPATGTEPAGYDGGSGGGVTPATGRFGRGAGPVASACDLKNPSPDIGGKDQQGVGPFLLTPAAAADMRGQGTDPNNPCEAARYAAHKLAVAAKNVYLNQNVQVTPRNTAASPSTTDYPWDGLVTGGDPWGMMYGQCVSFVAWMVYKNSGGEEEPPRVGMAGWAPSDADKSPINANWGNAGDWAAAAEKAGFAVDDTPKVGAVAQWLPGTLGPGSSVGHVAYVTAVYSDGSIDLAQYNFWEDSTYSTVHMPRGGGWDGSNGHDPIFAAWPDHFLHVNDDRVAQNVQQTPGAAPSATAASGTARAKVTTGSLLWKPNGNDTDMANARRYWGLAIDVANIFADRSAKPGQPCALPPADKKSPWSVSFKITYIWRCETNRMSSLYLVTGAEEKDGEYTYSVENDRYAAAQTLVSEAMSVSYGAGKWETKCDNKASSRQGIFPLTPEEARAAGVTDRCDQEQNIDKTARYVLAVEKTRPEQRAKKLGPYQPMVGGWQKVGIAMGQELKTFSKLGPGDTFNASDACTKVMTEYLTSLAPYASAFARLTKPPAQDRQWSEQLSRLEEAHHLTPPSADPACHTGSWSSGYDSALAQVAIGLAGNDTAHAANLEGLANYFQAAEQAGAATATPVAGKDPLAIPRLATYPLKPVDVPMASDTTEVWSQLGNSNGMAVPLDQLAIEYAWFYGGVIAPFDSAGKRIGSLANDSSTVGTVQLTVGPDGCPETAPKNTLLNGADKIGIHKLCVDSVAKARTPQAAMAIKWALSSLGWPYTQHIPARNTDHAADCSSFVSRAYLSAIPGLYKGNAPTTDVLRAVKWTHKIPLSQAQPGDLVEPLSGHVVMHLADGYNVQESHTGEVSHVLREVSSAFWAGWVDPGKV
jgi:surface antigen